MNTKSLFLTLARGALFSAFAAFAILASASTSHAQVGITAGTAEMKFKDGQVTLFSSNVEITRGMLASQRAVSTAKVILTNNSSGIRNVECNLIYSGISGDFAAVTLQPFSHGTVSMQIAKGPTSGNSTSDQPILFCRVTSSSTSNVVAQLAKITTVFVSNLSVTGN